MELVTLRIDGDQQIELTNTPSPSNATRVLHTVPSVAYQGFVEEDVVMLKVRLASMMLSVTEEMAKRVSMIKLAAR